MGDLIVPDVALLSLYCEYVLLPMINKETDLVYGKAEYR